MGPCPEAQEFDFDVSTLDTPAFVMDLGALDRNLAVLARVQAEAGCKILLALKGFAMWALADRIRAVLPGTTASGPIEARLGKEKFGGEVHCYSAAFSDADFAETLGLADHIVFNTPAQARRHLPAYLARRAAGGGPVSFGLRVNHLHREVETAIYDPAAPESRLGVVRANISAADLEGIEGLHFHSLCESGADALARTLPAFEAQFADLLPHLKWVNFGGGHFITRPGYDVDLLIQLIRDFRTRHSLAVYLEPGAAIALNAGVLVAQVLDVFESGATRHAILDTSATCHMPDVLEMPYRPRVFGAGLPGEKVQTYRLGGLSCLAGDVIGDYSFDAPLEVGQRLIFADMGHYTMVKTSTFNGVRLPDLTVADPNTGRINLIRRFGYEDYAQRLS